jgi:hypothetical protein
VSGGGWWAVAAAWALLGLALLGLALLAAAGLLAVFVVLAAVAWLVLLGVRAVLAPQFAPPWHATARPERHRLADDLAVPIAEVTAAAELDAAAAVGRERPRIGAARRW